MRGYLFAVLLLVNGTCGSDVETSEISSASSESGSSETEILPASAAGSPSESGPGVPEDFTGTPTESIPITQEELASIQANEARESERAANRPPTDLGFGKASPNKTVIAPAAATTEAP
jgi:hypothetical protein